MSDSIFSGCIFIDNAFDYFRAAGENTVILSLHAHKEHDIGKLTDEGP